MPVNEASTFARHVRDALLHLHDVPYLHMHPLARRLPGKPSGAGRALQRLLFDAIELQRPASSGPANERARRRHELLCERYVEAQDVRAVCGRLGLSRSEYHREHKLALAALTASLADELAGLASPDQESTAFVGRDHEVARLVDRIDSVRASRGQVVLVEGDAGIGKSRLLRELRRHVAAASMTWLVGRCVRHGRDIAYYPIIDLLKTSFRIEPTDAEPTIVEKIDRALAATGDQLTDGRPFLRYLLSVDPGGPTVARLDPPLRKARILEALRAFLLATAAHRPLIVVIEDAQWIDPLSEEFLRSLGPAIVDWPVLLIVSHRPVHQPVLGAGPHCTHLVVRPLVEDATGQIARTVLGGKKLPADVQALIHRKAAGNPLFVEEVTRSLLEIGAIRLVGDGYVLARPFDDIEVPTTVRDVILARIDRLPEQSRDAMQAAAVIGREFTAGQLARAPDLHGQIEDHLHELRLLDLIQPRTHDADPLYAFKHDLTQAVAYSSLLAARREQLHRLVGEAIADLARDRLVDQCEVLAYHYERGGSWREALAFRLQSADKAIKRHAVRDALGHFDSAWTAAGHLGSAVPAATLIQICRGRAQMYWMLGEYPASLREADAAIEIARRVGDRVGEIDALADAAWALLWAENFPAALARTAQAIAIGRESNATTAMAHSVFLTGYMKGITGHVDEARDLIDEALRSSRVLGDRSRESLVLGGACIVDQWQGCFDRAEASVTEAIALARASDSLVPLYRGLWSLGMVLTSAGKYDPALAALQEALALVEEIGDEGQIPRMLNTIGWLYGECGDLDRQIDLSWQTIERASRRRPHGIPVEMTAFSLVNIADALMARDDLRGAEDALERTRYLVEDESHDWMKWRYEMHFWSSLAALRLRQGDLAWAEQCARRSLAIAVRTTSRKYLVQGWRLEGEVAIARREWLEAEAKLGQARSMADVVGNPPQIWQTDLAIGRISAARGDADGADRANAAVRQAIGTTAARLRHPELRASLARRAATVPD